MSCEIIVAADGNDGTREFVSQMASDNSKSSLRVIGGEARSGKGRGIREAVALTTGRYVGFMDADLKVPVEEFDVIKPWLDSGCDVVFGSRALAESSIERFQPWYRRIGSLVFYSLMQVVVGLPDVHDSQCGFKFFTQEAARTLFGMQKIDGYIFDVEVLYIARALGYRMKEVPIRWRDDGDTRLELVRGNIQNVRDLFRIRYRRPALSEARQPDPTSSRKETDFVRGQ